MSSGKKHKPWNDRVHESVVSRNKSGQLNLVIKGGAEEAKFPYFAQVKQEKVIYHSGKIVEGEILLEVNDQSVSGLTLYDLNNLIKQARDPVRFRTVKEGAPLVKDLKVYLSQRFNKDTVDYSLQAAIRDNLYLRSLPCTTRKLREGEIDGVDYTFLSVEEFQELEKSGALLESGIYEGNYYGTPKPTPVPLSPPIVRRSNSANDLPGLHPSSDGKRKRNRSNIEQLSSSSGSTTRKNHIYSSSKDPDKTSLAVSTKERQSSPHMAANDTTTTRDQPLTALDDGDSGTKVATMHESLLHSEKILGPLPEGWEMGQTETGDCYFIDHHSKKTSWLDPRLDSRARKNLEDCDDDELPYGWEKVEDSQFGIYYVDHIDKKTQYSNPVLEAKLKLAETTAQKPPDESVNTATDGQTDPSLNNHQGYDRSVISDPSQLRGVSHLVPIEKSSRGFGFTIVGGDDPKEFLQIKSVVPDGPAAHTGNIQQGDVIAKVNDTCVLGWTHPDVVRLFQAIPIGQVVTLELCRGYPLMIDPDDPSTNMVTTYAINADDKPIEDFERQLRLLNSQLEQNDGFYSQRDDITGIDLSSSPSKSMPDISHDQPYEHGYYGNVNPPTHGAFPPQNIYGRSGSMGALPTPVVMQVITKKGGEGFGFTIADSPQGQRVKQVLDAVHCNELMEGDTLLEINGTIVQNMPHNNVVQILKDCPHNQSAIFVIQRGPLLMHDPSVSLGARPNYLNGPTSTAAQQFGYPPHAPQHHRMARMKRSQTEPGLGSENGSVVSAPPGSTLAPSNGNHPVTALLNEYRMKHNAPDRPSHFNPPISSAYQSHPGQQSLYHDPYLSQPLNEGYVEHTVVLRREESGFGFRILGGNSPNEPVTIGAIVTCGAADKEGSLRYGDELLTVDGQKVTRIGHNQVILLMGNAARNAVVQLGIRRKVPQHQISNRAPRPALARPPPVVPVSRPVSRGPGGPLPPNRQSFDIVVHRRQHEGFGFVIISSVKTPGVGVQAPHKIGRIIQGSPAARCGHLHVDDRVLAINNVDLTHLHHGQIVNLIKDSGFSITLRVLPVGDVETDGSPAQNKGEYKVVELLRSKKGFGFGIRGGREYNMPLYVLRVAPDGPAAESGEVKVGDILIEINGSSTVDIPHGQAINLIKQGGAAVRLLLKRGDGNVPEIEQKQDSNQSLSSSAVSGSDQAGKNGRPMQSPPENRAPTQSQPPKSPVKSLPFGMIQPPAKRSSRKSQSSLRKQRQRSNSSGQVLPEDPSSPNVSRLRRAVTPNPTLSSKEVEVSPTGSEVGIPVTAPLENLNNPSPPQPNWTNRSQSVKSKPQASPKRKRAPPIPTSVSSPTSTTSSTSPSHAKENGTSVITNEESSGNDPSGAFSPDVHNKSPDDPEAIGDGKASSGEDEKKSKSKRSKFGKATKVGLWLSPKKK